MGDNSLTIVAAGTFIRGDVFSEDVLVVEGAVEGNVVGNKVIVKPKGWVHGDVSCRSLKIELGGVVDGAMTVAASGSLPAINAAPANQLPKGQEESEVLTLEGGKPQDTGDEPGEKA